MNQNYQHQYSLSLFINTIRNLLLNQEFFEQHLYSTINYKIEHTDYFKLRDNLYLRYNPEPDIWQVGINHDKFFWIGSMFRNEKKLSDLHQYEFTVVDIYQAHGTMNDVIAKYIEILKTLEEKLKLPTLSDLEIKYVTHEELAKVDQNQLQESHWLIVTDYPVNESFYDAQGKDDQHTSKFEIFFVVKDKYIEIAACGILAENLNKHNLISDNDNLINKELIQKNFIGFGVGIERLMYVYALK